MARPLVYSAAPHGHSIGIEVVLCTYVVYTVTHLEAHNLISAFLAIGQECPAQEKKEPSPNKTTLFHHDPLYIHSTLM